MAMTNPGATTALAEKKPPTALAILTRELERIKPTLKVVLPRHLDADRIVKMALTAYVRNDDLKKCTIPSVIRSVILAAEIGLEPGGLMGEAYLVPFNTKRKVQDGNVYRDEPCTEAQLIPGYKGLIKLARQSGDVSMLAAYVVDEADEFDIELGLNPILFHKPNLFGRTGQFKAVYAVVKFKDGTAHIDAMSKADIDAIRARSAAGKAGPWVTDYNEMARKTMLKRILKMVPMSSDRPEAALAIAADNAAETGERFSTEVLDALDNIDGRENDGVVQDSATSRTSQLADRVGTPAPAPVAQATQQTLGSNVPDAEFVDAAPKGDKPEAKKK